MCHAKVCTAALFLLQIPPIFACIIGHRKVATLFSDGFWNAACSPSDWFLFIDP